MPCDCSLDVGEASQCKGSRTQLLPCPPRSCPPHSTNAHSRGTWPRSHFSLHSQRGPSWFHSHHGPAHAALWLTPGGEAGLFVLDLRLLQAWAWPTRHLPSLPTPGTQPSVRSLSTSPLTLKGAAPSSSLPVRTIFPAAFHSASCLSFTPQLEGPLSARLPSPSCPSNLLSCSLLARASAAHSTIEI